MVGGDGIERGNRLVPVDSDMGPTAGNLLHASLDERCPVGDRYFFEDDGERSASPQDGMTVGGTHIACPVALAEHRDQVPPAVYVGQTQRESTRLTAAALSPRG